MNLFGKILGCFWLILFISVSVHGQTETPKPGDDDGKRGKTVAPFHRERQRIEADFIDQTELSEHEDSFVKNRTTEFLIVNTNLNWDEADIFCSGHYSGILAVVNDNETAAFLAEAISETNHILDTLWVGGKHIKKEWWWVTGNKTRMSAEVSNLLFEREIEHKTEECLSFVRNNHNNAQFFDLNCRIERPFICQRPVKDVINKPTHPGWITIGSRMYKIFYDRVTFINASTNCQKFDKNAKLAVIVNYTDSQQLARYLLIGRPSLENAWIGAKWVTEKHQYEFVSESLVLPNITNDNHYPPWRGDKLHKTGGCLLLDRHLSNTTLFVEARCSRLRSYICYKKAEGKQKKTIDFLNFPEADYRLYFDKVNWYEASSHCDELKSMLAEPNTPQKISHMITMMGENVSCILHLWIGGRYDDKDWKWDSDKNSIEYNTVKLVQNTTYEEDVENMNTCLNLDRENHIEPLSYGADCTYPQSYICQFKKGTLQELINEENKYADDSAKRSKLSTPSAHDEVSPAQADENVPTTVPPAPTVPPTAPPTAVP